MSSIQKAVALRYPENAQAPYIASTAKGHLAQRLVEIARENNVPVVENQEMVEILSVQDVGTIIPEETFQVIAGIFAFVKKVESAAYGQ